jgi:SMC interacting uncharacterized protein involved in chromosome segregation
VKNAEAKMNPENNLLAEIEAKLKEEQKKNAELQQTVDILKKIRNHLHSRQQEVSMPL